MLKKVIYVIHMNPMNMNLEFLKSLSLGIQKDSNSSASDGCIKYAGKVFENVEFTSMGLYKLEPHSEWDHDNGQKWMFCNSSLKEGNAICQIVVFEL